MTAILQQRQGEAQAVMERGIHAASTYSTRQRTRPGALPTLAKRLGLKSQSIATVFARSVYSSRKDLCVRSGLCVKLNKPLQISVVQVSPAQSSHDGHDQKLNGKIMQNPNKNAKIKTIKANKAMFFIQPVCGPGFAPRPFFILNSACSLKSPMNSQKSNLIQPAPGSSLRSSRPLREAQNRIVDVSTRSRAGQGQSNQVKPST